MGQVLLDLRLRATLVVEHRPRLGIGNRHPHALDAHARSFGRDRAPGVGTRVVTVTADRSLGADSRYISYIDDTTRENMSPTHHNTLVGYVSDNPKPPL